VIEVRQAQSAQLPRVVLDEVVGIDDLLGPGERQAVRRVEHGHPGGRQHPPGLAQHRVAVGHVLERLHRDQA